jgi:hypothetical protein
MSSINSYNSDKFRLQSSIEKLRGTLKGPQENTYSYKAIEEETGRLLYRQEAIYRMFSTVTVVAVFLTVYRASR